MPGSGWGGKRNGAGRPTKVVAEAKKTSKMVQRELNFKKSVNIDATIARDRAAKERPFVADTRAKAKKSAEEKAAREAKAKELQAKKKKRREEIEKMETEAAEYLVQLYHKCNKTSSPTATEEPNYCSDDDSDYEDDTLSDEEEDDDNDPTTSSTGATSGSRNIEKYFPPPNSPVANHIEATIREIQKSVDQKKDLGPEFQSIKKWYPPVSNSLKCFTSSDVIDPTSFYLEGIWIYAFLPFLHHSDRIGKPLKAFKCIGCQKTGALESQGWYYRPAHRDDHVVWIVHRRFVCRNGSCSDGSKPCGKSFASFDPKFMPQLPNAITESFPFMMTSGGQGMALSMVRQFMFLCTSGILFRKFAKSINEAKETQYWVAKANYYDNVADIKQKQLKFGIKVFGKLFSQYGTAGEYNGIPLKASLVKELFLITMRTLDPYIQESFQLHLDEAESSDHSFRTAARVKTFFRTGKVYSATYDSISLHGFVNFNRFCHTKSNDELQPILLDNAKIRKQMCAPELKLTQGDGGGDSSAWKQTFKKQLKDGAQKPQQPLLPVAGLKGGKFEIFSSSLRAENLFLALASKIAAHDKVVFGLDTEADDQQQTRVIQICLPSSICDRVIVLDLSGMGVLSKDKFAELLPSVKTVLNNKKMVPVAVNITYDVVQLARFGIRFESYIDLMNTAKELQPNHSEGFGMQALCRRFLGCHIEKDLQTTDWAAPLTHKMAHYAALDAYGHLLLYQTLQQKINDAQQTGRLPINSSMKFGVDQGVNLLFNGRVVASGTLKFVGNNGNMKKFGEASVGKDKAVVLVQSVFDDGIRPPFCFKPTEEEIASGAVGWDHTTVTLSELLEQRNGQFELTWPIGRLAIRPVDNSEEAVGGTKANTAKMVDDYLVLQRDGAGTTQQLRYARIKSTKKEATKDPQSPATLPSSSERIEDWDFIVDSWFEDHDDDDDSSMSSEELPRSRNRNDRFHVFQSFPSSRDPKAKAAITVVRRLVIQALTEFDPDDFERVERYLAVKKRIHGMANLMDHFYFNREWWYRRVRVFPPSAEQSAKNLHVVANTMLANEELAFAWSDKVGAWFDSTIDLCRQGKLEESYDCKMYQWDGEDKNGLHLYLRFRGSNRSELLHQKMRIACGAHGIGIEVGHYILVLVSYRFNISTGIRRKNWHDFGMPYLHLVDRVQTRMIQLYDVDPFPNHVNQELAPTIKGIVCVGVGPLNYDEKYVTKGRPDSKLKGNMLFLAKQMQLVCPPLHIAHRYEKKIFNDFMANHPSPTWRLWDRLACIFLERADAVHIFPKLPSMLRSHYSTWKSTQHVIAVEDSMRSKVYRLLTRFGTPRPKLSNAALFQKKESDRPESSVAGVCASTLEPSFVEKNKDKLTPNPMPVAPAVAPSQSQYVPSTVATKQIRVPKSCSGIPFGCDRLAIDCCGLNNGWQKCKGVMEGSLSVPPTSEARAKFLDDYWRRRRSELTAERRKRRRLEDPAQIKKRLKMTTPPVKIMESMKEFVVNDPAESLRKHKVEFMQKEKVMVMEKATEKVAKAPVTLPVPTSQNEGVGDQMEQVLSELTRGLSDEEEAIVAEALYGEGPPDETVAEIGNDKVIRESMRTLRPTKWLNDEIITQYYRLLGKRERQKCYFFTSFFFTKLLQIGNKDPAKDGKYDYDQVKRWTKRTDIFKKEKLIFAINLGRQHWICAMIELKKTKIQVYDSGGQSRHRNYLGYIFQYLQDEHLEKKKCPLPDVGNWDLVGTTVDTPRQRNGFDCGVFTCMFADFLSRGHPLVFSQQHVNHCRKKIALAIKRGRAIL